MLNAGNRGCNACHEDLWDKVVNMKEGLTTTSSSHVGYEKDAHLSRTASRAIRAI